MTTAAVIFDLELERFFARMVVYMPGAGMRLAQEVRSEEVRARTAASEKAEGKQPNGDLRVSPKLVGPS